MEFYVQDTRQIVGNSMVWWKRDGHGYCCDVRQAEVFSEDAANIVCREPHFRKWPKPYIDPLVSWEVDSQMCDIDEANGVTD